MIISKIRGTYSPVYKLPMNLQVFRQSSDWPTSMIFRVTRSLKSILSRS